MNAQGIQRYALRVSVLFNKRSIAPNGGVKDRVAQNGRFSLQSRLDM
jgi:hypothetical protein